jgi:hypothetical protein
MKRFIFTAVILLAAFNYANATQVMPGTTLDMVVNSASDIFTCIVEDVSVQESQGTAFGEKTIYKCRVTQDVIKGNYKNNEEVTIVMPRGIKGLPVLQKNIEYLLMLPKASDIGFRVPVAFDYGTYSILTDKDGNKKIRTNLGTETVFKDVIVKKPGLSKSLSVGEKEVVTKGGTKDVNYTDFISIIKKINIENNEKASK